LKVAGASVLGAASAPLLSAVAKDIEEAEAGSGPRYAMIVDIRRCQRSEGCTKCMEICHQVHNVPDVRKPVTPEQGIPEDQYRKREIKWIWKTPFERALPNLEHKYMDEGLEGKEVPVFCNHCENPACVRVCPTQATWKRENGIVTMDMHRCIGCRYCILACPYGARNFNWLDPQRFLKEEDIDPNYPRRMKGVVEKCLFCEERVMAGGTPACVEVCPNQALIFGDLRDESSKLRRLLKTRYTVRRKPGLGTDPQIYYIV